MDSNIFLGNVNCNFFMMPVVRIILVETSLM